MNFSWAAPAIKPGLFWCLNRWGRLFDAGSPVMLTYHEVEDARLFGKQLRWLLQAGRTVVPLRDVCQWITHGTPLPDHAVVLTFDDGYRSQFDRAAPLLKNFGMTATFFVLGDRRDGHCYWEGEGMTLPERKLMDRSQLRTLLGSGLEIGCHALSHRHLTRLNFPDREREIREGKSRLEDDLGQAISFFSYPYGALDAQVVDQVRSAGFAGAVSTIRGAVRRDENPFVMRRMTVIGKPGRSEFLAYLTGAMDAYLQVRSPKLVVRSPKCEVRSE